MVLVTAAGIWVVRSSSLLTVRQVIVVGVHRLTAEQVERAAAVEAGLPLARVDLVAVRSRVAELPQVRAVAVTRSWPHTVRIAVEERQPAVAVPAAGGYVLVDFDAVSFETVVTPPRGVPRLAANPAGLRAGTVRAVVTILDAVPDGVRRKIREIVASSDDDVNLLLADGTRVVWGSAQNSARKAVVLVALMGRRAAVYDVSAPDAPATSDE